MINANQLRIGNWVYPNEENATPYTVKGIALFAYFGQDNNDRPVHISYDDIEPIPLTPDILERCGFETCCCKGWRINNKRKEMTFHLNNDFKTERGFKIKYLHTLQNYFFSLTGTELIFNP